MDQNYVYAYAHAAFDANRDASPRLFRLTVDHGSYRPFVRDGKTGAVETNLSDIFGESNAGELTAIAVYGNDLVVARDSNKLVILDAESAVPKKSFDLTAQVTGLAFDKAGRLYLLSAGKVFAFDLNSGQLQQIETPGLGFGGAISVDPDGNIVVYDSGPDLQIKVYSPDGKLVYTAGDKGGRPLRGPFNPEGMRNVSSIAVDGKGQIWAVETGFYPRRVSVWGRDGKLVRDYIGNTGYCGVGVHLYEDDPSVAYVGPIELKLNRQDRTWKVDQILWVPGTDESFEINPINWAQAQRFRSKASGQMHDYLFKPADDYYNDDVNVLYMETDEAHNTWQPVAAFGYAGMLPPNSVSRNIGSPLPQSSGEFAGLNAYDGFFWNDQNGDGKVQRSECEIIPKGGKKSGLSVFGGWGARMSPDDLSFYADGIVQYKPIGFNPGGAPLYGAGGMRDLGIKRTGGFVPVPGENEILAMCGDTGYPGAVEGVDSQTGQLLWSYPTRFPNVHASHAAPMSRPGLIIGDLKIMGVADVSPEAGKVFAMRGNMGEDYFLTTDGLYVGALFQDVRLPTPHLPPREADLVGKELDDYTERTEPFNGWFGKQSDGKFRLVTSLATDAGLIAEVKGLETVRRFTGPKVMVDEKTLAEADQANRERKAAALIKTAYVIQRVEQTPDAEAWKKIPALQAQQEGSPEKAAVRIVYDRSNLYLRYEVDDATPMLNQGKDYIRLFKTGDAVDFQIGADPTAPLARKNAVSGDERVVMSILNDQPAAVLMRPVDPTADKAAAVTYSSPIASSHFDRVQVLSQATVTLKREEKRYVMEASIPLSALGLAPTSGLTLRGDVGFISSNTDGTSNVARTYWSNKKTGLSSDEPNEAMLVPAEWGEFKFQ